MAYYTVDGDDLSAIADKIRAKKSISTPLAFPDDFVSTINSIHSEVDYETVTKRISISSGKIFKPGELVDLTTSNSESYIPLNARCSPIIQYSFSFTTSPTNRNYLVAFAMLNASDSKYHIYVINTYTSTLTATLNGYLEYRYRVYTSRLR